MYELFVDAASATMNYKAQFFVVIKKFRHYIHLKKMRKKKIFAFNLAFAVDESNQSKFDKNISFRKKNQSISTCVCGEKYWFSLYSYFEKNKRFIDWKSDASIQKKVNEALKDSHKKKQIESNKVRNIIIRTVKGKDNLKDDVKKMTLKRTKTHRSILYWFDK